MANTNINNNARNTHSAPGIYTTETDLTYTAKSLGITTLGLVGETLKGPAFQVTDVTDFGTYKSIFGGTSTELFRGSKYPKYELPYIAKEYLTASNQLQVCRVLGLSGVNAGQAWIISAFDSTANGSLGYSEAHPVVIAVLRSRGEHKRAAYKSAAKPEEGFCEPVYEYDGILYYATDVKIKASSLFDMSDGCTPGFNTTTGELTINTNNYGTFTLEVTTYEEETKNYAVTLNPGDKNYILNVLGTDPQNGETEIYVEELYDVALKQLIEAGEIDALATLGSGESSASLTTYPEVKIIPAHAPVEDFLLNDESTLSRKNVGERYLYTEESINADDGKTSLTIHISTNKGKSWTAADGTVGHIYTVVSFTNTEGTREYYYGEYQDTDGRDIDEKGYKTEYLSPNSTIGTKEKSGSQGAPVSAHLASAENIFEDAVLVKSVDVYYALATKSSSGTSTTGEASPITLDLNNYKEQYREAISPWILSEVKGDAEHVELNCLFRFHTISDGDASNTEVKISIEKIDPDGGTFNVIVRDFYDTDGSQIILERFAQCDLVPGSSNYIAYKIGSTDGAYESKSKYITVEVNENDKTRLSIPAGFMGYPVRCYEQGIMVNDGTTSTPSLAAPYFKYNTNVDDDIKINRQYFGISDLVGIDEDILKYKGVEAYNGIPSGLSPCFHLDARILSGIPNSEGVITDENNNTQTVSIDGTLGYSWSTVGKGNTTDAGEEPRIGSDADMVNTIYENINYRKFTVCMYGGWDGWDYYRTIRSNGDDYTYLKYRGTISTTSGEGGNFSRLSDVENYGFEEGDKILNSDYYAYLSGYKLMSSPTTVTINVLATPGIDYVNNQSLVEEVIDIVENDRKDTVYVVTTPDRESGADPNAESEMFTPSDAVYNLEDTDIDSNYTCTLYPWVKYWDTDNSQYIYLPATKDAVRDMATTDNEAYPWYAPTGWNRGIVNALCPKKKLKLGDEDTLSDGRINYIKSFAKEGYRLWGDRNLQIRDSQMNRIAHRRLLIHIREKLAVACVGLIFDPLDATMRQTIESTIDPILSDIRSKRGLDDFKIDVDDSQEARDRLEANVTIHLKLVNMLEYININFVVTPSGTDWD